MAGLMRAKVILTGFTGRTLSGHPGPCKDFYVNFVRDFPARGEATPLG